MRSCHVAECIIVVPTSINPTPPTINCTTPFHLVKAANLAISETLFAPVPSGHGAMSQGSNSTPTPEEAKGHQLQASMMKSQGRRVTSPIAGIHDEKPGQAYHTANPDNPSWHTMANPD